MNSTYYPADVHTLADTLLENFREEVLEGLCHNPKRLQSKYFYDKEGDRLFQQIMASPEYYLTDCEEEIFRNKTAELAHIITSQGSPFDLIELGAGDATKSQYLLQCLAETQETFTYMPIDISGNILSILGNRLKTEIPRLDIRSLEGEYFNMLGRAAELSHRRKVVMFLGANIGNMEPPAAQVFCEELRQYLNPGDLVLMGFDLKKNPKTVLAAYNDQEGLTARFNLNLLTRLNRELGADFDLDAFEHYQTYDPGNGACKSYLVSLQDQNVTIGNDQVVFKRDETIYMEISQKYTAEEIEDLARNSGFEPITGFSDAKGWFVDTFWAAV